MSTTNPVNFFVSENLRGVFLNWLIYVFQINVSDLQTSQIVYNFFKKSLMSCYFTLTLGNEFFKLIHNSQQFLEFSVFSGKDIPRMSRTFAESGMLPSFECIFPNKPNSD